MLDTLDSQYPFFKFGDIAQQSGGGIMKELSLEYFELAQEFNYKHGKRLREAKLHVRGNFGSCSLISFFFI